MVCIRNHRGALAFVLGALAVSGLAGAQWRSIDAEADIRALRDAYNRSIQGRDMEGFTTFLSPTVSEMVSSGNVVTGREAVAESYATVEFKDPTFIVYDRQPDTVEISPNGKSAVERGHWVSRRRGPAQTESRACGAYQAGWVHNGLRWQIQTEAYVDLGCAPPSSE